jgi:hypothetical protein
LRGDISTSLQQEETTGGSVTYAALRPSPAESQSNKATESSISHSLAGGGINDGLGDLGDPFQ